MVKVCQADGVQVTPNRAGRMVHVDSLPEGVDPDHHIVVVESADFVVQREREYSLHDAALDMLKHHDTLHPGSSCEWATRLLVALRG